MYFKGSSFGREMNYLWDMCKGRIMRERARIVRWCVYFQIRDFMVKCNSLTRVAQLVYVELFAQTS